MSAPLSRDFPRLQAIALYLDLQLQAVRRRIAEAGQWEASRKAAARPPSPPEWTLQVDVGAEQRPVAVHHGECVAGARSRRITRRNAIEALAVGVEPSLTCRPDRELQVDCLKQFGTAEDGRLFRASQGGRIRSTEYTAVWQRAREKALTPVELASPLAAVPYSLRHAIVSLWIKAGVDPVKIARRAGHSVAALYRSYAKVLHGTQTRANALIEQKLGG
ncbi:DUF6233 domain-containing protein [Streptomyces decoyicus]|uniref:DUF6233 domain-containing protein n=1 Tax=Streptomyces decoyicus TaxID=249567 RepID=UPI00340FFD15